MADPTPNPPLWQVMHTAYWKAAGLEDESVLSCAKECEAAVLRAIAEGAKKQFACFTDTSGRIVVETLVNWLLAEADRAEAGE